MTFPCGYEGCLAQMDAPLRNSHSRVVTKECPNCSAEHDFIYDNDDKYVGHLDPRPPKEW